VSRAVITAEGLGKRYRIGRREGYRTLAETITRRTRNGDERHVWALRDVSLEVRDGEILGLIGPNGAGKTTLLKILSRITEPTTGEARIQGRVGSLLEVGTGFHPELTGRENVFLNGAILGMDRPQIRRKFDDIVDFADVARFIDTPVKYYSSGMYVRLGFAVAAFLEPEILLVDEVLAVGDAEFQRRCLGKLGEVSSEGRTIIFVSHNMSAVARLCTRGILLRGGRVADEGGVRSVIETYLSEGASAGGREWRDEELPDGPFRPRSLTVRQGDEATEVVNAELPFTIALDYELLEEVPYLLIQVTLRTVDGIDVMTVQDRDDPALEDRLRIRPPGRHRAACTVPGELLNEGRFVVSVNATTRPKTRHFFTDEHAASFNVFRVGGAGSHIDAPVASLLRPRLAWEIEQLDTEWAASGGS
jgi:lipopolysaccharide transport system ATP-binding protein